MAVRLNRSEAVERNREAVLAAARRVFLKRGYAGATLESIAEEAGFSKGVMYSQFGSKADLFLALLERRIDERARGNERIVARHSGAHALRQLLVTAVDHPPSEAAWARVLIEFRALVSRDPRTNARYAELHGRTVQGLASVLDRLFEQAGSPVLFPTRVMAEFILAVDTGFTLERAANTASLPMEIASRLVLEAFGLETAA